MAIAFIKSAKSQGVADGYFLTFLFTNQSLTSYSTMWDAAVPSSAIATFRSLMRPSSLPGGVVQPPHRATPNGVSVSSTRMTPTAMSLVSPVLCGPRTISGNAPMVHPDALIDTDGDATAN